MERGFPLSLSTSPIVRGRFFPALDLAALNMAALVLLDVVVGLLLGVGLAPGTVNLVGPVKILSAKRNEYVRLPTCDYYRL